MPYEPEDDEIAWPLGGTLAALVALAVILASGCMASGVCW